MLENYLNKIKSGSNLLVVEAEDCLKSVLENDIEDNEIVELIISLAEKGESNSEIRGFSNVLLSKTLPLDLDRNSIDLCGTGGSGLNRFNVSTTSAFILASGGINVIKHGNKGSQRLNGSFDLLDNLNSYYQLNQEVLYFPEYLMPE